MFNTIDELADAYVTANRLKSESAKANVRRNFIENFKREGIKLHVIDVEFDRVFVEVNGIITEITI